MSIFKHIFYFSSANNGIWQEVWYETAASLDIASSFAPSTIASRMKLAHPLTIMTKIRTSQVDSPRVSVVVPYNVSGTAKIAGDVLNIPVSSSWSATCTISAPTVGATRKWWLRGCAREFYRDDQTGRDVFHANFKQNVQAWLKVIQSANFCILKITPVGQGGIVKVRCIQCDGTPADGTAKITTAAAHGLVADNVVSITQANKKELPGLNGRFKVIAVADATHFTVNYRTPENVSVPMTSGYARKITYVENAIISASRSGLAYIGERKTKNDLTGSRGARSAQRVRQLA